MGAEFEREARGFFDGGGDVGALMRAKDWSKTALGPIETWPQSLRTTISTCLNSRFPILIWWGPELVKLYNDAYRELVGDKHPSSLGGRGRDVWPEIWHIIGPMLESVQNGQATWSEDQLLLLERHGFPEECYFTFAYSPIRDESGGVGGVFSVVSETTRRVIGERRLRTLQTIAAKSSAAKTREEACRAAGDAAQENIACLPFSLIYLIDRGAQVAQLASVIGLPHDHPAAPAQIPLDAEPSSASWPVADVAKRGAAVQVNDLATRFGSLPAGNGMPSPHQAMLLPIGPPGDIGPAAVLVTGISARLTLDDQYLTFLTLVAGQLASAIANAHAIEEAERRAEALKEIDRAKTTFFSNISHEFRTPLTLMLGPTEDAVRSPGRSLDGAALDMVHRNELRLLKLVNALLDFSRVEADRVQASYRATDLAALTTELASAFESAIARAGMRLEVACDRLTQHPFVDRDMWEKIVLNLLSNAFKFTFEGSIRVSLCDIGHGVALTVADSGVGIAEAELPRLFERFHRIEGSRARTHEGSGIGLALVHTLVELHGGAVTVASQLGVGTTFTVTLPYGTAHLPPEHVGLAAERAATPMHADAYVLEALRWLPNEADATPAEPPPAIANADTARVLIADDNADMRGYLARILGLRWQVATASNGAEALALTRRWRPSVIVTDVMMPNGDGFDLLKAIHKDPTLNGTRVVMLSARAGEEAKVDALAAGAHDYMVKPFSARELVASIASQLALAEAAHERELLFESEQRARREAELQKEHLHALFMQAPTPICILRGRVHDIELANPDICRVWGRPVEQVLRRPLFDVLPELRGQAFEGSLKAVLDHGKPYIGKEIPARFVRDNGVIEDVIFNFVYSPLRTIRGDIDGILLIAFDVTEQVKARQHMTRLHEIADTANRAKDDFLAMLGHELRNPLAALQMSLEVVRRRPAGSAAVEGAAEKHLETAERQSSHLGRIVDDLLDVARITRGKIELRQEQLDLGKVVANALESSRDFIEARAHEVSIALPLRPITVFVDPVRLEQTIGNLLINAAKYTDRGGRIAVTVERCRDVAEVRVKDNGIGIPPELLPRVFDLFQQGERDVSRTLGGLGIGLTVARSLVEQHGGSIEVRSEGADRGSEFIVRLPMVVAADMRPARETPVIARAPAIRRRVLVVDDNIDAADSLADLVEVLGHDVRSAHDGLEALRIIAEWRPDIVFVDIGLPGMDGYDVARELRRLDAHSPMLVALTGYGQESDRLKSVNAGFSKHLVKPADVRTIEAILRAEHKVTH